MKSFGRGKLQFKVLRWRFGLVSLMVVDSRFGVVSLALNGVVGKVMVGIWVHN